MGALESWLQPAVVVAVVLHVWRPPADDAPPPKP